MINTQDCWLYAGYKSKLGYGTISTYIDRKSGYQYAHRVSYETFVAPIPEGLVIDHLCRMRACINPEHLEPVTASVNTLRGEGVGVNTRKTHCPKGHEYTPENTVSYSNKWRRCRQCIRIKNKSDYARRTSPYA